MQTEIFQVQIYTNGIQYTQLIEDEDDIKILQAVLNRVSKKANDAISTPVSSAEQLTAEAGAFYTPEQIRERDKDMNLFLQSVEKNMAEQYMRHDYRSMWEIWGMMVTKVKETYLNQTK